MRRLATTIFVLFLGQCAKNVESEGSECQFESNGNDPTLLRSNYGLLRGSCSRISINDPDKPDRVESVISWLGVPYAEPPIGPRRFLRPVAPTPWPHTRNATKFSPRCTQTTTQPASEDCLYLNIYAPLSSQHNRTNTTAAPLPIFVYVHGGAFVSGSASDSTPSNAVALANIIYVTINYRLGPFGFIYEPTSGIPGNMAFLDQHAALLWVHEHAALLNGDPTRITLGGHSAGAFAIGFHLIYAPSWPLFSRVILQSGSVLMSKMTLMARDEASRRTNAVFELLGCPSSSSEQQNAFPKTPGNASFNMPAEQRLACAQNSSHVTGERFLQVALNYWNSSVLEGIPEREYMNPLFFMVADGVDFNETVRESFTRGHFKPDVDIINGYSRDDGSYFVQKLLFPTATNKNNTYTVDLAQFSRFLRRFYHYFPSYPTLLTESVQRRMIASYSSANTSNHVLDLTKLLSEHVYICSSVDLTLLYARRGVKVFRYAYEYVTVAQRGGQPAILGAKHGAELAVWSAQALTPGSMYTLDERKLSKRLLKYWTSFVKCGDPNCPNDDAYLSEVENVDWPVWAVDGSRFLVVVDPSRVMVTNDSSRLKCDLWREFSNYPRSDGAVWRVELAMPVLVFTLQFCFHLVVVF